MRGRISTIAFAAGIFLAGLAVTGPATAHEGAQADAPATTQTDTQADIPADDPPDCKPVPGVDIVLDSPARVLWFGEVHGTAETPALFGDLVCAVAAHDRRPVVVALERDPIETEQWLAFLHADAPEPMTAFLLTGAQWRTRAQDGRNSEAMLALALRLRDMVRAGLVEDVALIDDAKTPETRDADMAAAVQRTEANHPGARIVVLSGNVHAMRAPFRGMTAAAGHLAPGEVYSVAIFTGPGTRWDGTKGAVGMDGSSHPLGVVAAGPTVLPAPLVDSYDAVAFTGTATTASAPADDAALTATAPVHEAYAAIEATQARQPPPASDRERLERLWDLDQTGRLAMSTVHVAALPREQQMAAFQMMADDIDAHDRANQAALKAMMPKSGWFRRSVFGGKAADAALLVVLHAEKDPGLMRDGLKRVTPLAGTGEIDDTDYARLYDRVALAFEHRPQRYGTQVVCSLGHWRLEALEDPAHVDDRRRRVGFPDSEADYLKSYDNRPCG